MVVVVALSVSVQALSQENSPFSRFGLGDIVPNQPVAARGMGGLSAAFSDQQAVNTQNPASYGQLSLVTYDFGGLFDSRTLRSNNPSRNYQSINVTPNYLTLGIPLSRKRQLGMVLGLRPYSRINYNLENSNRLPGIDSVVRLFEGSGGMNQVFTGIGKSFTRYDSATRTSNFRFSIGANGGYIFGRKNATTTISPINDTVSYQAFNYINTTNYSNLFFSVGVQTDLTIGRSRDTVAKTSRRTFVRLGAFGNIRQNLRASTDSLVTSVLFGNGRQVNQDTVLLRGRNNAGTIVLPSSFTVGISIGNEITENISFDKWQLGVEYSATQWNNYRFLGQTDKVQNSHMLRMGGSITPRNPARGGNVFQTGTYRLGFYTGTDYINADGNGLRVSAFTAGFGFNLRKFRSYDNQFTQINLGLEAGRRGTARNNLTEQFVKVSLGLSLSDIWFIKRKYD